ncbi:MAG: ethanolamine permease [Cytophagales bacterium]|nr:ethanolamine permease [Cytophagales bacterium]
MVEENGSPKLKRTLGPVMLWGLGVGYVIGGMYFGWNLGLKEGGTLGLAIATGFIIVMYLCFTFSYTELACAIPKAGGVYDYATRALGKNWGFIGGMAQNIEFIFAPPAVAFAIGAYFNLLIPGVPIIGFAIIFYLIFTFLNIRGIQAAAMFELFITIIAVVALLIFAGATLPSFEFENLEKNALPNGYGGVFAAIPFAIWFFLAIEGVANVAEETRNPQRNILIGFGSAILTLVILCALTFVSAVGVGGWENVVFDGTGATSDSPLPLALKTVVGESSWLWHLLIAASIIGLVASFHGIILAAGRTTMEFGATGSAPKVLGKIHSKFHTPYMALIFNMLVGIIALLTGKTGEIITISCFGALVLYIVSMVSILKLRKTEPDLERPFRVPFYPFMPVIALVIATFSLIAMTVYNPILAVIFLVIVLGSYGMFRVVKSKSTTP